MTEKIQQIVDSRRFQWSVLAIICLAAFLVGVETYPAATESYGGTIQILNKIILGAFVVEAVLKMVQHGRYVLRYFKDPWNIFDFIIIAVCFLPIEAHYAAILRLARVFRSLRLVTALPKLQLLVNALIKSIPSMFYVGMMLFLVFYVYGVMAVFLFRDNDPVHFQDLQTSILSLFRVVTQEDWTDVMYIQMYGSDVYPYTNTTEIEPVPSANPLLGALFFSSFVFLGTMIMLNLFIGVILNSMTEAQEETDKQAAIETAESGRQATVDEDITALNSQLDVVKRQLQDLRYRLSAETELEAS